MWNMLVVDNHRIKWYIARTEISLYCTHYIVYYLWAPGYFILSHAMVFCW